MKRVFRIFFATTIALLPVAGAKAQSSSWSDASLGISSDTVAAGNESAAGACSDPVQMHLTDIEQQTISANTALASNNFQFLGANFNTESCLQDLIPKISIMFEPPNLSGILQALINEVCSIGVNAEQQAIAPIAQTLQSGLPSYELAPGISTGSIGSGIYIRPSAGDSLDAEPVQVNITPIFGYNTVTYAPINNGLLQ